MATRPIRGSNHHAPPVTTGGWNNRIRRFNRAVLNPLMLRVADRVRGRTNARPWSPRASG